MRVAGIGGAALERKVHVPQPLRLILMALGMSVLVIGAWGGLLRAGSPLPGWLMPSVPHHGPLMIGGFLGTLITLERAVALRRWWCFFGPAFAAAGAWVMLITGEAGLGAVLITAASIVLLVGFAVILHRQRTTFTVVMTLGAVAWFVGNVLWLGGFMIPQLVPWWTAFLVLTIVGERLDLSRFMPPRLGAKLSFVIATSVYGLGLLLGLAWPGLGLLVMGVGLVALAVWLSVYDVARRTIRMTGLPRFAAAALLTGYAWLAVGGMLAAWYAINTPAAGNTSWWMSVPMGGLAYDGLWHALLLGFVFSMIFGHAPIIFPAVLGVQMRFSQLFYLHLTLLHLTLIVRTIGGVTLHPDWRAWGAIGNALAILLFLVMTVSHVRRRPSPSGAELPNATRPPAKRVVPLHRSA